MERPRRGRTPPHLGTEKGFTALPASEDSGLAKTARPRTSGRPCRTSTAPPIRTAAGRGTPELRPGAGVEGVEDAACLGEHRPAADRRAFSPGGRRTGRQLHRSRGA